ncbi:hypothetical protein NKDENANG_03428 [Candidatus Entotheonellaceae bacterium PAL068K]
MREVEAAARVAGIEEDQALGRQQRRQVTGIIVRVRHRWHHQHDHIRSCSGFLNVGGEMYQGHKAVIDPPGLYATRVTQGTQSRLIPGVQPHRVAAASQVGRGGAATMPGAEDRYRSGPLWY